MGTLNKITGLVLLFSLACLAACTPAEPRLQPYDIVATEFLNHLSNSDVESAQQLASEQNGAKEAVPIIYATMQTMLANNKKERVEFKWVSSNQKHDKASVVFAQVLDGQTTMTNIRLILVKEGALDNGWRVIDLSGT